MEFVTKIIILATIIVMVALIYHFFFRTMKKKIGYNDLFERVLTGNENIRSWARTLPRVLGPNRLREAELLAERLPEGKILVAKEINRVWVGDILYLIEEHDDYLFAKKVKLNMALRAAYAKALNSQSDKFCFPDYVTDCEMKYMNPIQKVKYRMWKAGITAGLNKKLIENRKRLNSAIRGKYLSNTKDYLERNGLRREHVLPQAVKLFLACAENEGKARDLERGKVRPSTMLSAFTGRDYVEINNIADELQEQRALRHAAKTLARAVATETARAAIDLAEDVPLPRNNAADWQDPLDFVLRGGNRAGAGGRRNNLAASMVAAHSTLPEETIAERVDRVRREDNKKNSAFSQSIHDATLSSEVNRAVREHIGNEAAGISYVDRLARDFSRLYPAKAEQHREIFVQDRDKDYMRAFASIVYDGKNSAVKDNLIEALGYEIDNIAPFCSEGRKNKTWALLAGIDQTGNGAPIASRTDIIDSLLHEFGQITNTTGLSPDEMISSVSRKGDEFKTRYPALVGEIEKKLDEAKFVITDLYDDEINLYGNTASVAPQIDSPAVVSISVPGTNEPVTVVESFGNWGNQIGTGVATGIDFGNKPNNLLYTDLIPQERTLADPNAFRLDPALPQLGSTGHIIEPSLNLVPSVEMGPQAGPLNNNFSVDSMPTVAAPIASLTPVDLSNVTSTTPGAVFDFSEPLTIETQN